MPTFVIHAIGQPSKKISFDRGPIKVGRDPSNHLVFADATVSREHAVFQQDLVRRWYVGCVSETNPVMVDGQMVTRRKYVTDGTEILVGKEHLVVFCGSEATAAKHLGDQFAKHVCKTCGYSGMLRANSRGAACPDCGSREMVSDQVYVKQDAVEKVKEGVTSLMSPAQLTNILGWMKTAKGSRLERADGREPARATLSESEACALGRKAEGALKLHGLFLIGGGVTVAWEGTHFVARSAMLFPTMKINGFTRKEAALQNGDVLRVGSNHFRFVVEEPRGASSRPPPMGR